MSTLTILTPTYNRKELLKRLYDSLQRQDNFDFEWLIIDDGSSDGTKVYVEELTADSKFNVAYKFKSNGGKHTALNYAYQFITSPLVFIVDSDDYITKNAVSVILKKYNMYKDEKDLCGFSFLRGTPEGGYLSSSGVPIDGMKETFIECRINRGIKGDMAEVWYTKCLKEYPFPEFENEKFLGEDIVWVKLSDKYMLRFFNDVIYISGYLEDGLTNNRRIHNLKSPFGCVLRDEVFLKSNAKFSVKIKSMMQFYIYGRFAEITVKDLFRRSPDKLLFLIMLVPSQFLFDIWNRKYKV